MKLTSFITLVILGMATSVQTSKILLMPFELYSHMNFMTSLGKALKDNGHEVWVLAFDKFTGIVENRGLVPLTHQLSPEDNFFTYQDKLMEDFPDGVGVIEKAFQDPWWIMSFSRICDKLMQNETLAGIIQEEKFDLVVFDGSDVGICRLMIPYKFDLPFVTVHGFQLTAWVSGVTGMPSIEPEFFGGFSNRMDFWQRLTNLNSWLQRYDNIMYDLQKDHMDKYCPPNKPKIPLKKLSEMAEMYFMNFEIMCLDYPRVSAPNLQYLGGASILPPKPLPEELARYIADAEHGIILLSFGSVLAARQTWKILGVKLFQALARLPQRAIVQYRLDKVYGQVPNNVKLVKWLPQNDLLAIKKVKLFIGHGGNNGQVEAAYHGVPMFVIPTFTQEYLDQLYMAKRIEAHAYGKYVLDKRAVTSEELYEKMTEIINNKTYSENIKKCSEIIRSMPSAQEKFVFWVNHVLRFGGAHLRPPSLDMPLYQVLMLDIVAYYVIYYAVIFHLVIFMIYFSVKYLRKRITKKPKSE